MANSPQNNTADNPLAAPIINYGILARLHAEISADLYPELLAMFLKQGAGRVDSMTHAIAVGDLVTLRSESHTLKSEAATFGALQLTELATQINTACQLGHSAQALALAADLANAWRLVEQTLRPNDPPTLTV